MARTLLRRPRDQRGMTTAEYAVGTVAACGFGGILYELLTSDFGESTLRRLWEFAVGVVL